MWDRIKEFAEKHPIWLGLIVFGVGALIVWLLFGGKSSGQVSNSTDNTGYYNALAAATESGNQLQAAQLQLQAAGAATQANLSAQQDTNATQLAITQSNNNAQVQIATQQITEQGQEASLAAQTAQLQSTLQAQVAMQTNNSQVQVAQIGANVQTQTAQLQEQLGEQQINAINNQNDLNAQTQVLQAQYNYYQQSNLQYEETNLLSQQVAANQNVATAAITALTPTKAA